MRLAGRAAGEDDDALDGVIGEEESQHLAADETCCAEEEDAAGRHGESVQG